MTATGRNLETLLDDLNQVLSDMETLVKAIPDDLSDDAQKLRRRMESVVDVARLRCLQLERRVVAGARAADHWVHDRPYPVAGAALALGLLIGVLLGRRD